MNSQVKLYIDLFMAFFRPGVMTFGGGPSAIPLMKSEVVDLKGWITIEEFTDSLALGNALPGPIATKMSALLGYKVGGWLGAFVGTVATVLPTALAAIFLFSLYQKHKDTVVVGGMMKAVRPVVVVLVAQTVFMMAQTSFPSSLTYIIAGLTCFALFILKLNPSLIILIAIIYGGLFIRG